MILNDFGKINQYQTTIETANCEYAHGPLTRYVKLQVTHAPRMPGTFYPPPWVSDPDMHRDTCVTRVSWCMLGSLSSGFLWSRWQGKRSRHYRRMRNPQFYVSGRWPMILGMRDINEKQIGYQFIRTYDRPDARERLLMWYSSVMVR